MIADDSRSECGDTNECSHPPVHPTGELTRTSYRTSTPLQAVPASSMLQLFVSEQARPWVHNMVEFPSARTACVCDLVAGLCVHRRFHCSLYIRTMRYRERRSTASLYVRSYCVERWRSNFRLATPPRIFKPRALPVISPFRHTQHDPARGVFVRIRYSRCGYLPLDS